MNVEGVRADFVTHGCLLFSFQFQTAENDLGRRPRPSRFPTQKNLGRSRSATVRFDGLRCPKGFLPKICRRLVDKEHKGKGYELSKGRYVEIDDDELEAIKLESTHTIEIGDFLPAEDIDERYLDKPYYIVPNGKEGADAFVVIRDAMKLKGKVALARVVLSNREHILALKPLGKGLFGTPLRYPYELRDEEDYFDDIPNPRISKDMVKLASHILDTKASKFNPSKFKDKYEAALKTLVNRKAAGKPIEVLEEKEDRRNVIDLMDALKQSLKGRKSAALRRKKRCSGERKRKGGLGKLGIHFRDRVNSF